MIKRISLWSGPRNISTAFMYSFAQRIDTHVLDEPFYTHYLLETEKEHPGWEEVIDSQGGDYLDILKSVIFAPYKKPVLFIKNMAHHTVGMNMHFIEDLENIFLIRKPGEVITSFIKNIENPTMEDLGYKRQWELFEFLKEKDITPAVIDAKELLTNPRNVLQKLCAYLNLDFMEEMLHWEAGPKEYDGIWAKYWYENVHKSKGFQKYEPKKEKVPQQFKTLEKECEVYYNKLLAVGIKSY